HRPKYRLSRFFSTLYSALAHGARAVFQFYPENDDQLNLIMSTATHAGFTGGLVIDYPNSKKAKKYYLCLFAGQGAGARQELPRGLGTETDDAVPANGVRYSGGHIQTHGSRRGKRSAVKDRDWVIRKKEAARALGKKVANDSKEHLAKVAKTTHPDAYVAQPLVPSAKATRDAISDDDKQQADTVLRLKKAWDQSLAPAKSLPMTLLMMWMSGNSVQIFNLMITAMMFFQPVKALMGVQQAFQRFEPPATAHRSSNLNLLLPKVAFCLLNLVSIGLGLYKCSKMGLLPTTTSDWLAFETPREVSDGGTCPDFFVRLRCMTKEATD
ncbi:18S rRNA (guanine1575-N7)-methyltransferase, partial [Dimargaris xerosporica]